MTEAENVQEVLQPEAADEAAKLAELAEREAAVAVRERKVSAAEMLRERRLPASLIACVNFLSEESFTESFEALCTAFSQALGEEMSSRIQGGVPKKTSSAPRDAFLEGLSGK